MNILSRLMIGVAVSLLLMGGLQAQVGAPATLTRTTLSSAMTATQTTAVLASVTPFGQSTSGALAAPSSSSGPFALYIDRELMDVVSVSSTTITVRRATSGSQAGAHPSAAPVWWGLKGQFQEGPPPGQRCTSPVVIVPWIDVRSGIKWLCRSSLWNGTINDNVAFNSDPGQTTLSP